MRITHVFRGDEHINNTPWQINIFRALGGAAAAVRPLPDHPRRGRAQAVQAARRGERDGLRRGRLPARGDAQLPGAPGLEPWRRRAVQRANRWCSGSTAATWPRVRRSGIRPSSPGSTRTTSRWPTTHGWRDWWCATWRRSASKADRRRAPGAALRVVQGPLRHAGRTGATGWRCSMRPSPPSADERATHLTEAVRPALRSLRERLRNVPWDKAGIAQALKDTLAEHKIKMPQLAPPARVAVCGRAQTPAIDAVLALFDREVVLSRAGRSGTLRALYNPALARSALPCGRLVPSRGYSSAGRALAWHARGQRFDPAYLHHTATRIE